MGRGREGRQLAVRDRQGRPASLAASPHHRLARYRDQRDHEPYARSQPAALLRDRRVADASEASFAIRLPGPCAQIWGLRHIGVPVLSPAQCHLRQGGCRRHHRLLLDLGGAPGQRFRYLGTHLQESRPGRASRGERGHVLRRQRHARRGELKPYAGDPPAGDGHRGQPPAQPFGVSPVRSQPPRRALH